MERLPQWMDVGQIKKIKIKGMINKIMIKLKFFSVKMVDKI